MSGYTFQSRWTVNGVLATRAPLHIGDGDEIGVEERANKSASKKPFIQSVATDCKGQAYIPGSSLKGVLHAWAKRNLGGDELATAEEIFGSQSNAGRAEFGDAFAIQPKDNFDPGRDWHPVRLTSVASRTAIERTRRTASEGKLFQLEFVPKGISFRVSIRGARLKEDHVKLLLFLLSRFDDAGDPVLLGAETGSGFGRCSWTPGSMHKLDRDGVLQWLQQGNAGYENLPQIGKGEHDRLMAEAGKLTGKSKASEAVIRIRLEFQSPFLVNDPTQCKDQTNDERSPDHAPLRLSRTGVPYLPATSFRGALRAHVERIARTIYGDAAAGRPDTNEYLNQATVHSEADLSAMARCKVSPLFGAPGWRAPLQVSDFTTPADAPAPAVKRQEFVAIDRFTGGGADKKKFNAEAAQYPAFEGEIRINLERLQYGKGNAETLQLLAYALRDLKEGDIPLGFGGTKGYGAVQAKLWFKAPSSADPSFADVLDKWLPKIAEVIHG